jgi:hypothetical protein
MRERIDLWQRLHEYMGSDVLQLRRAVEDLQKKRKILTRIASVIGKPAIRVI